MSRKNCFIVNTFSVDLLSLKFDCIIEKFYRDVHNVPVYLVCKCLEYKFFVSLRALQEGGDEIEFLKNHFRPEVGILTILSIMSIMQGPVQ